MYPRIVNLKNSIAVIIDEAGQPPYQACPSHFERCSHLQIMAGGPGTRSEADVFGTDEPGWTNSAQRAKLFRTEQNHLHFTDPCSYYAMQSTARFHVSRTYKKDFRLVKGEQLAIDLSVGSEFPTKRWEWPWWRSNRQDSMVLPYILLIHLTAVVGLILFPLPGWPIFLGSLTLSWIGGIGTTVVYHRSLAHRALRLHPWVSAILTFFAVLNGSGNPRTWVASHRIHHAYADTENDVSSPVRHGFWWAHLRWLWQQAPPSVERYCPILAASNTVCGSPCNRSSLRCHFLADCISAWPPSSGSAQSGWSSRFMPSAL